VRRKGCESVLRSHRSTRSKKSRRRSRPIPEPPPSAQCRSSGNRGPVGPVGLRPALPRACVTRMRAATLWGSRSRPEVVTCGDRGYPVTRHDHGRVASPALPVACSTNTNAQPRSCAGIAASYARGGPTRTGPDAHRSTTSSPQWSYGRRRTFRPGDTTGSMASCSDSATGSVPRRPGESSCATASHRHTQATSMLAVDFRHVDCAVTLRRLYVPAARNRWSQAMTGFWNPTGA
jgi:hypothetical protein